MRFPMNLRPGGTIGFLAPSFGCATEPYYSGFQNALKTFEKMGYQTILGPNCTEAKGVGISNAPELCGKEVMDSFADPESNVLISCGGGELMCEILDDVDFEQLKKLPAKWFMGYSDNTNLTFLLATLADTASIYGPCASTFGMETWHPSLYDCMKLLTGASHTVKGYDLWEKESQKDEEHPLEPYHLTEKRKLVLFPSEKQSVQMEGRLLGGCLDCLQGLVGTRFDRVKEFQENYKEDGIIWFLEACDLNVYSTRRALWQMVHAGWFDSAKGFLIGRPRNGEELMGLNQYDAVLGAIGSLNVPVIMGVDIGHLPPMMPIIVGSYAKVTVDGNNIQIDMKKDLHSEI